MRVPSTILVALLLGATPATAQTPDYPPAHRVTVEDTLHGEAIPDPYRWLETTDSPEARAFYRAQDSLTESFVSAVPARERIRRRIEEIGAVEGSGPFYKRRERLFTSGRERGGNLPWIDVQEGVDGEPRRVLESVDVTEEGENLVGYVPSLDGRKTTLAVTEGQSRWRRVRVLNLETGELFPETLVGLRRGVTWDGSGEGFYYVGYEPPEQGRELESKIGTGRIYQHRLGTPQSEDRLVWEDPAHPERLYALSVTPDGRRLFLGGTDAGSFSGLTERVWTMDPTAGEERFEPLLASDEGGFAVIGQIDDRVWARTTVDGSRGRVIAFDVDRSDSWTEVLSERDATLQRAALVGGRLLVLYVEHGRPRLVVHDLDGDFLREVELPHPVGTMGTIAGDPGDPVAVFGFVNLVELGGRYRLDVETGEVALLRRPRLPFDPDDFVVRQVFYESFDGTRIPMTIAHRRGAGPDGSHPLFLYGYGAFGWIAFPWFQPHVIAWMEMGGVYALPNIRGGGEYGETWHAAGRRRNKPNAIADYLAAAEWLRANGWARPDGLVANGGSASGVIAAAASIRRPELFGAVVIDIPVLDMLRYHRVTVAGSWIPEFGRAEDPADFEVLRGYSPYHTVEPGACYPPTLVIVGEEDEIAPPFHGYKHVARMQRRQACANPILLEVVEGAGHSYGTDPGQFARTWSDAWAFLVRVLGLEVPTGLRE